MNDNYKEYFNVVKNIKVDNIGELKKSTFNLTYIKCIQICICICSWPKTFFASRS